MENRPQFYQGDVLLEYVNDSQPAESLKGSEGRLVIARGERTGHAHTVDAKDVVLDAGGTQLWVLNPTEMTHTQFPISWYRRLLLFGFNHSNLHPPLPLEKTGMYAITLQRRYTPKANVRVID